MLKLIIFALILIFFTYFASEINQHNTIKIGNYGQQRNSKSHKISRKIRTK